MKIALILLMPMTAYGQQAVTACPECPACPLVPYDCCGDLGACPNSDGTCDMETTCCPAGCCPESNWYCCPDWFCAATAADCALASKRHQLLSWVRGPLGWAAAKRI